MASSVVSSIARGLLILVPVVISVILLLRVMTAVAGIVRPIAGLLPEWLPAERFLSLILVLFICFIVGAAVQTAAGRAVRRQVENSLFEKIPGYSLFRSLTRQVAGMEEQAWKPVLAEIEDALVPAFIIEEFGDGRLTIFVPSAPTPLTGSIYVLTPDRVHLVDASFTDTIKSISRWGSGLKDVVQNAKLNKAA